MNETKAQSKTKVIGYSNPHQWPVYVEVSECNFRVTLPPGEYIKDRQGKYFNDPVFDDYVSPKGLSRTEGDQDIPVYYVPRIVRSSRPMPSVTQATAFVRDQQGSMQPVYSRAQNPEALASVPANKTPYRGMTIEEARKAGLIGKPRIVPEDYGADETSGAPGEAGRIPGIKYSIESNPKVNTQGKLPNQLVEADPSLPPGEAATRVQIQQKLMRSAAVATPTQLETAVEMEAEAQGVVPVQVPRPVTSAAKAAIVQPKKPAPVPVRQAAMPAPVAITPATKQEDEGADEQTGPMPGVPEPLEETEMPDPNLQQETPDVPEGKRFVCLADGKAFNFRSELDRHVKRKYQDRAAELMQPYPPE